MEAEKVSKRPQSLLKSLPQHYRLLYFSFATTVKFITLSYICRAEPLQEGEHQSSNWWDNNLMPFSFLSGLKTPL